MQKAIPTHDKLHSVESAAEFLGGVSVSCIRAWLTQRKLTRVKLGTRLVRIRESELLATIRPQRKNEDATF